MSAQPSSRNHAPRPLAPSLVDRFCRWLDRALALALALMVAMVFGNVVLRYAFNSGITASEELSRWLFVWLTFLGAWIALKDNAHLGTDIVVSRLGRTGKRICLAVTELLMLGCCVLLLHGAFAQARINLEVEAPVTGWSMAVVYAAGIAFAVPAIVLLAARLWRTLAGRMADHELVAVQESEDRLASPSGQARDASAAPAAGEAER